MTLYHAFEFVENLFSSLVVDLKTAWIINCSQNTIVTFQKAIFCYYSPNIQCSLLLSNFTQIQIVSEEITNFWPLVSNINPSFNWKTSNLHKDYIFSNISSHGKFGKLYQQSTSLDYAGQSAATATAVAVAMICASSKSSA